jgi:hypothetical protein
VREFRANPSHFVTLPPYLMHVQTMCLSGSLIALISDAAFLQWCVWRERALSFRCEVCGALPPPGPHCRSLLITLRCYGRRRKLIRRLKRQVADESEISSDQQAWVHRVEHLVLIVHGIGEHGQDKMEKRCHHFNAICAISTPIRAILMPMCAIFKGSVSCPKWSSEWSGP